MSLTNLPLGEAMLADVRFDWAAARCTCSFRPDELEEHVLIFTGVTALIVSGPLPLPPSSTVMALREPRAGQFEIELHSGDVLRIAAANWEFRKERRQNPAR